MIVFGIYDVASDTLQEQLYTFANAAVAKRAFKSAVAQKARPLLGAVLDEPGDFYLVQVAELVQAEGGKMIGLEKPKRVFRFDELLEDKPNV